VGVGSCRGEMGEGASRSTWIDLTLEEKACLDCLITKNRPEMGLERASRFIHYLQWEYLRFDSRLTMLASWPRNCVLGNAMTKRRTSLSGSVALIEPSMLREGMSQAAAF
jgi:hypothetical protein